jgi:hypothetical protein
MADLMDRIRFELDEIRLASMEANGHTNSMFNEIPHGNLQRARLHANRAAKSCKQLAIMLEHIGDVLEREVNTDDFEDCNQVYGG